MGHSLAEAILRRPGHALKGMMRLYTMRRQSSTDRPAWLDCAGGKGPPRRLLPVVVARQS